MALESGRDWIDRSRGALLGQRAGRPTLRLMLSLGAIFGLSVLKYGLYVSTIDGVEVFYW